MYEARCSFVDRDVATVSFARQYSSHRQHTTRFQRVNRSIACISTRCKHDIAFPENALAPVDPKMQASRGLWLTRGYRV